MRKIIEAKFKKHLKDNFPQLSQTFIDTVAFQTMHKIWLDEEMLVKMYVVLDKNVELNEGYYNFLKLENMDDLVGSILILVDRAYAQI